LLYSIVCICWCCRMISPWALLQLPSVRHIGGIQTSQSPLFLYFCLWRLVCSFAIFDSPYRLPYWTKLHVHV
jgi:hypothetical protein